MSTSYITAKRKNGKSRVRSIAKRLGNVPKLVSRAEIEAEARAKVLQNLRDRPPVSPSGTIHPKNVPYQTYSICKNYGEENDHLCDIIKTDMGMDLTNTDVNTTYNISEKDIKDLYFAFIRRYMRFLKFRNAVSTQFVSDEYFYIDYCPFIENEQFRNFINFDISLGAVMKTYSSFIELDFEAVENIVDSNGNSRLDKLYRLLYNQVLINAGPYYEYIIKLLKIHEGIKKDLSKTINKTQDLLDKNMGYINDIKKGDTISPELRELVLYYINNSGYNSNNKKGLIFNLKIGDNEIKLINFVLEKYNTLCNYDIDDLFNKKLVIEDTDITIAQFTEQIKVFDELYSEKVSNIENIDEKAIITQFIEEVRTYYRNASNNASSSARRVPALVDGPLRPPLGPPLPLLRKTSPSRRSISVESTSAGPSVREGPVKSTANENAIEILMKKFFL